MEEIRNLKKKSKIKLNPVKIPLALSLPSSIPGCRGQEGGVPPLGPYPCAQGRGPRRGQRTVDPARRMTTVHPHSPGRAKKNN